MRKKCTYNSKHLKKSDGFTLVELAIVMIIIGLLIGGILKGQELIINARTSTTIAQFRSLASVHATFKDTYKYIPGDLPLNIASRRLPNCLAAGCSGGNGDGRVGNTLAPGAAINSTENIEYWKHLALADLITGVDPNAPNEPANAQNGVSNPVATIGGTWNAFTPNAATLDGYGNRARGTMFEIAAFPNTRGTIVLPSIAERIDRKIDDGLPNTGSVSAEFQSENCDEGNNPNHEYLINDAGACILYFVIGH